MMVHSKTVIWWTQPQAHSWGIWSLCWEFCPIPNSLKTMGRGHGNSMDAVSCRLWENLIERGLINKNTCYFIWPNGGSYPRWVKSMNSTVGALAQNSVIFLTFPSCSYKGCNCSRHYGLTQQWSKAGTETLSQKAALHFLLNSFGQDICD